MADWKDIGRRKVRYWCFRKKTEADGGNSADEAPQELVDHFESLENFQGWTNFGVTWDIDQNDFAKTYKRKFSVDEEWNATLRMLHPGLLIK
jgi:hypothetical protein